MNLPPAAEATHREAVTALAAGRPALAMFDRALAFAPGDHRILYGRISAILAERGLEPARAALEAALDDSPGWAAGHARLANLRWQSGDRTGFVDSYDRALVDAPGAIDLWGGLLAALMQAERHAALLDAARRGRAAAGAQPLFDAYEAAALDELGESDAAARLYAAMQPIVDPAAALYHLRHLLRRGLAAEAAALAWQWAGTAHRPLFLSYLATAWRLLDDPRWRWLEGDERLIGVYDLDLPLTPLADLLRSLHKTRAQPLDQSLRGGTQTEGALFDRGEPEIIALKAALAEAATRHFARLPPRDPAHPVLACRRDGPVLFAGSWSVSLGEGGHHINHRHPGSWFSSAFYVALQGDAAHGPAPAGWLVLGEPPAELGLDMPPLRLIEPKPGRLVLFPSIMWHGTRPFPSGERLTVAFDLAIPG